MPPGGCNTPCEKEADHPENETHALLEALQNSLDEAKAVQKVRRLKKHQRTYIRPEEWQRLGYCHHPKTSQFLDIEAARQRDIIERIDVRTCSSAEFEARFEATLTPTVLTHAMDHWTAFKRWRLSSLFKMLGPYKFRCGEDDDGYPLKLKFKYFLHYALTTEDDAPLYLFDGNFHNRGLDEVPKEERHQCGGCSLLYDYEVPTYFKADLLRYSGSKNRPPYRWFVMGPARSGTNIHQDPLGTSAWNALVFGHKRWALFPPDAPRELIKPKMTDREAIAWFHNVYPQTLLDTWKGPKPVEILQSPGEIVYVPPNWWHVVLNMDQTVAVTQNFVSERTFPYVFKRMRLSRPTLCKHWLKVLQRERPDLAAKAKDVDEDTFSFEAAFQTSTACLHSLLDYDSSSSSDSSTSIYDSSEDGSSSTKEVFKKQKKRKVGSA